MDGYEVHRELYIGDLSSVCELAKENYVGSYYQLSGQLSGVVNVSNVERIESEKARWKFEYSTENNELSGDEEGNKFLKQTWTMQMSQVEYPLYKYLSAAEAANVASWENTPNEQKKVGKYISGYDNEGNPIYADLEGRARLVADKLFRGIESVTKSLPVATRTTIYRTKHSLATRAGKLNHIDATPDSKFDDFGVEWLKVGFDWNQDNTGTWTLVETWTGAPSWDKNLYGDEQWEFVE